MERTTDEILNPAANRLAGMLNNDTVAVLLETVTGDTCYHEITVRIWPKNRTALLTDASSSILAQVRGTADVKTLVAQAVDRVVELHTAGKLDNFRTMNWVLPLVPCAYCRDLTSSTGTKVCDPCWEVTRKLEDFIRRGGRKARLFVYEALKETLDA